MPPSRLAGAKCSPSRHAGIDSMVARRRGRSPRGTSESWAISASHIQKISSPAEFTGHVMHLSLHIVLNSGARRVEGTTSSHWLSYWQLAPVRKSTRLSPLAHQVKTIMLPQSWSLERGHFLTAGLNQGCRGLRLGLGSSGGSCESDQGRLLQSSVQLAPVKCPLARLASGWPFAAGLGNWRRARMGVCSSKVSWGQC